MGLYTTLFHFFFLINLKLLKKAKFENLILKQIQSAIPTCRLKYSE